MTPWRRARRRERGRPVSSLFKLATMLGLDAADLRVIAAVVAIVVVAAFVIILLAGAAGLAVSVFEMLKEL